MLSLTDMVVGRGQLGRGRPEELHQRDHPADLLGQRGVKRAYQHSTYSIQSLTGPSDNMVPSDSRGFPAVPSKFLKYFGIGILYHHIAGYILRFVSVENL